MVQIQNADAINAIRDGARLSISEGFPTNLSNVVQPVLDMTPHFHKKCNVIKSLNQTATTAGTTIYAVPAGRKYYICGISVNGYASAVADSTKIEIIGVIDGITTNIYNIAKSSLVATNFVNTVPCMFFPVPIVIDGGTNITYKSEFTVGAQTAYITLYGYEVEENH